MESDDFLCSRNARPQKALVGRAQWKIFWTPVGLQFWAASLDHGNYVPSTDLTKAITQASRYIYEVEREANSVKFLE